MDTSTASEVDLHRLALRFADARVLDPRSVEQLARSIERSGQLIACIAVAEDDHLVLVDGYRRILALRRLGRDTACVESWSCDLAQALLTVLALAHARPFAAVEEALLVRELVQRQGLSQREVARRRGRDVSWVSRRLELVCALPDALLAAVRKGELSTWAATRVLAPLARANAEHATHLLDALAATPLCTRELQTWFQHYQTSPHTAREHMVDHPRLFIEALHTRDEQRADARLRDGPEAQCAAEARQLLALIKRLHQRLPTLNAQLLPECVLSALTRLSHALDTRQGDLARYCHDPKPEPRCGANSASPRPQLARDQPNPEAVA
jgi:ParB family transcriptional regulator, chromosome partitioning protein